MSITVFDDPEMQEIFEGFLVETQELLDNISQDLMILENSPDDLDLLNRIFRSFHTIKGTSSFMGFDNIAKITHHAEDILNKLRKSELRVNQPIIDVLLEVYDWIVSLMDKIQEGNSHPDVDFSSTIGKIELLKTGVIPDENELNNASFVPEKEEINVESIIIVEEVNNQKTTSILDSVLDNRDMFDKPGDFTDDELDLLQAAFEEINKSFKNSSTETPPSTETNNTTNTNQENTSEDIYNGPLIWDSVEEHQEPIASNELNNETEIKVPTSEQITEVTPEVIDEPKIEAAPKITENKPKEDVVTKPNSVPSHSSTETIRVDVQRLETLMNLSGELVLGRNRLTQLTNQLEILLDNKEQLKDLAETTTQIDFITSEIQSAVMKMRMVPIGKLFQKSPRIVRDLAKEFGKKINLVLKGEETEIDRGIIEELNDPLVHMIRNSCDHGVESPQTRKENGKPETGTIILDADQEGNNIVLKIIDDGNGMDPEKLKTKAIEKGVITAEQAAQMTNREAFQLIFAPGFSTAAKVSAVSGRGVGMDVVKTNIQKLKGIIDIESELGKGTTFIIKLPLTLAIIQGLLVKVQQETYAIPLSSVIEVVSLEQDQVYTINKQEVIRVRSEVLPIIRLDKVLNTPSKRDSLDKSYVVSVGLGLQRVGFVVDELLGQQEIVIKSLGEYLGSIKGIAGSTIMGDGRVIMIIDIAQLLENIYNEYSLN